MRILKQLAVVVISLAGLCLLALPLRAQYVSITITDCSNDTALRAAVSAHDTIDFNCGSATITLQAPLEVTGVVAIDGGGMVTLTGAGLTHHFVITGNSAYLGVSNITLSDGFADTDAGSSAPLHSAGSIYNAGNADVINVTFLNNRAEGPAGVGGIYNSGYLKVDNSRFVNQQGGFIGAFINDGITYIHSSLFENNRGNASGALLTRGSTNISGSIFRGNQSVEGSGALLQQSNINLQVDSASTLIDLILANNSGQTCGAISIDAPYFFIYSTTISTNTASVGGAVCVANRSGGSISRSTISGNQSIGAALAISTIGSVDLSNVTIANNTSIAGSAGGIYADKESRMMASHVIVANNGAQNCSLRNPPLQPFSNSVIGDQSCNSPAYWQEENTLRITDPLLNPLADNGGPTLTHLPHPDSPARAIGGYCDTVDQRGILRWKDTCDAGSVEVEQRDNTQHLPLIEILDIYPTPTSTPPPQ